MEHLYQSSCRRQTLSVSLQIPSPLVSVVGRHGVVQVLQSASAVAACVDDTASPDPVFGSV